MIGIARFFSAGLLVAATSGPAVAQSTGEVTILMGAQEQTLPIWSGQSDWSGPESWPSISIRARGSDGAGTMVLALSFEAAGWSPAVAEMELSRYEDGARVLQLFGREETERGGLVVQLETHAIDGTLLTLTGQFVGMLGTSETFGRDIDLSGGTPVSGSFSVALETLD